MLSVIIPTRNRADALRLALKSLLTQSLSQDRFELLVIDNGSTDTTREVVESFGGQLLKLRYFFESEPGLHVGRHRGMKEASGSVLVYADDDIQATETWLHAIHDCFQDPAVALVGGNNHPNFEETPPGWLQRLWSRRSAVPDGQAITSLSVLQLAAGRRTISPLLVWGCNFSIRRQVLLEAGGFHPDAMPKEQIRFRGDGETHVAQFVRARGLKCVFDSGASVYHAVPRDRMTFEYFRMRAFNQGISDSYTHLRAGKGGLPGASFARVVRARIKNMLTRDDDLRRLDRVMREGHREGYAYHQAAYREDADVRAWVHKLDYF